MSGTTTATTTTATNSAMGDDESKNSPSAMDTVAVLFRTEISKPIQGRSSPLTLGIRVCTNLMDFLRVLATFATIRNHSGATSILFNVLFGLLHSCDVLSSNVVASQPFYLNYQGLTPSYGKDRKIISLTSADGSYIEGKTLHVLAGVQQREGCSILLGSDAVMILRLHAVAADNSTSYYVQTRSGATRCSALDEVTEGFLLSFLSAVTYGIAEKPSLDQLLTLKKLIASVEEVFAARAKKDITPEDFVKAGSVLAELSGHVTNDDNDVEEIKATLLQRVVYGAEAISVSQMSMEDLAKHLHSITSVNRLVNILLHTTFRLPRAFDKDTVLKHQNSNNTIKTATIDMTPPGVKVLTERQKLTSVTIKSFLSSNPVVYYSDTEEDTVTLLKQGGSGKRQRGGAGKGKKERVSTYDHAFMQASIFQALRHGVVDLSGPEPTPSEVAMTEKDSTKKLSLF